jgi:hypothetical protein
MDTGCPDGGSSSKRGSKAAASAATSESTGDRNDRRSAVQRDVDLKRLRWALKHTGLGVS